MNDLLAWLSQYLHDSSQLIVFTVSRKDWNPKKEFRTDASERPHVNCGVIREPQQHFRRSIVPRLDIRKDLVRFKACTAKVYDLDIKVIFAFKQDVFRLEVAMNEPCFFDYFHSLKDLRYH